MPITIRDLTAADEARWRELWVGYCEFYETDMPDDVTDDTWRRLLDDGVGDMFALVACDEGDKVIGFTNCVLHPITWSKKPVCYLEDLFVAPDTRKAGAGRALIDEVCKRGREQGWNRVYWSTRENNTTARGLYDKVAGETEWVTYKVPL